MIYYNLDITFRDTRAIKIVEFKIIPCTIFIFCKDIIEINPLNFQSRRRRGRSYLILRRRDIYKDSKLVATRHALSQLDHLQINCDPSRCFNYSVSPTKIHPTQPLDPKKVP